MVVVFLIVLHTRIASSFPLQKRIAIAFGVATGICTSQTLEKWGFAKWAKINAKPKVFATLGDLARIA